jgi:predicted DNA-binding protein
MSDRRLSVRVSVELRQELDALARRTGERPSDVVRKALQEYCRNHVPRPSAYELARKIGLIGCGADLPGDLSTNPAHFEGFGRE